MRPHTRLDISLKTFLQAIHEENIRYWLEQNKVKIDSQNLLVILRHYLENLLQKFQKLFELLSKLPLRQANNHTIKLVARAQPPNICPFCYLHYHKDEMEKIVEHMLDSRIIHPSVSPYSSPILLVKKKDGGQRFYIDYRALNKLTILEKFPIFIIDELLNKFKGVTIFLKLNLKSRYHQIWVVEEDIEKTTFKTHNRHYEFLVMPFYLSDALNTFQTLMNNIFHLYVSLCWSFSMTYQSTTQIGILIWLISALHSSQQGKTS